MHDDPLDTWRHGHSFGQEIPRSGEWRTIVVIGLTSVMMVVEILAGWWFGSMALLADGLHMASHAAALSVTAVAYVYTRRHAHDPRFSFGTGKVNALGGFTSAVLLLMFALVMVWESVVRMLHPIRIAFNQAIGVAAVGLVVNGVSAIILHHKGTDDGDAEGSATGGSASADEHDHNLRAAYFHVLADALTSILAIAALLAGKWGGWIWLDPAMGVVGAVLVSRWSWGLLGATSSILLDRQGPEELRERIRRRIEEMQQARVTDLHLWSIGPGIWALEMVVVAADPQSPDYYKSLLPAGMGIVHATVEVHAYGKEPACQVPRGKHGEQPESNN